MCCFYFTRKGLRRVKNPSKVFVGEDLRVCALNVLAVLSQHPTRFSGHKTFESGDMFFFNLSHDLL